MTDTTISLSTTANLHTSAGPVEVSVERITPELAALYLTTNVGNRPLRPMRLRRYGQAMKSGQWRFTGEPILFNTRGELINGQHRLTGSVEEGATFEALVIRGVNPDAYLDLDSGLSRQATDALAHIGEGKYSTVKATAARCVIAFRAGLQTNSNEFGIIGTNAAIAEEIGANSEIYAAALDSITTRPSFLNHASLVAFQVLAIQKYGTAAQAKIAEFIDSIVSGANLAEDDPRYAYRRLALNSFTTNQRRRASWHLNALIVAWNAFIAGRSLKQLRTTKGTETANATFAELSA